MQDCLDIYSTKEREESEINSRLRADVHCSIGWVEGREDDELDIFESCLERHISMISVLDGFNVRRLVIIQEKLEEVVLSS